MRYRVRVNVVEEREWTRLGLDFLDCRRAEPSPDPISRSTRVAPRPSTQSPPSAGYPAFTHSALNQPELPLSRQYESAHRDRAFPSPSPRHGWTSLGASPAKAEGRHGPGRPNCDRRRHRRGTELERLVCGRHIT